ncbi:MAG: GTP 3',8-cyclase MoaA [Candidatus Omnitrophica bacterium]|nr:GTP 3',8-cyclase MoaA [Candidatus Omnitrophota bacterium]
MELWKRPRPYPQNNRGRINKVMSITDALNRPLRDLRISLIDRCNCRCPYCMPSEGFHQAYQFLDKKEWLSFEEIVRLVRIFVSLGVTKLRLTGGEPLLRPDIDELIRQLSAIKGVDDLALTTNGFLLKEWAPRLKEAQLGRLTVSLDTLDEAIFRQMSGQQGSVKDVLHGICAAEHAGFDSIKINCVVQRGINDHTILDLVKYFYGTPHTVRFIEYMDVGNQNHWENAQVVASSEVISLIDAQFPLQRLQITQNRSTSETYRFKEGKGEIGFISSVTKAFCGTCSRLRLSADGKMYPCLFATHGMDLGAHLRGGATDEFLSHLIRELWIKREDHYSEIRSSVRNTSKTSPKIEMFQIGG